MKYWVSAFTLIAIGLLVWLALGWHAQFVPETTSEGERSTPSVKERPLPREGMAFRGDQWVCCYELQGNRFAVIGDGVRTKSTSADGLEVSLGDGITVNVPRVSRNRVRLINTKGIREVTITPEAFDSVEQLIDAAIRRQ